MQQNVLADIKKSWCVFVLVKLSIKVNVKVILACAWMTKKKYCH